MTEFKFYCPQCGKQIQCGTSYSGTQINCPVCQQPITVPQVPPGDTPVAPPPVATESRILLNVSLFIIAVFVLAALVVGGWYGYSKLKMHKIPPGLVSLWTGKDDKDSVAGHTATLTDIVFSEDKSGPAFVFNGMSSQIRVPASPGLNVGLSGGFTVETWISPVNLNLQEICEWNQNNGQPYGAGQIGVHMEINEASGDGSLWGNIVDSTGVSHNFHSANGIIIPNTFQQIAITYEKATGAAVLYRNGQAVATENLGVFTPQTSFDFFMGNRPSGVFTGIHFHGKLAMTAIYNRALSAGEIQTVYAAQAGGTGQ